jgi:hypothetical protein
MAYGEKSSIEKLDCEVFVGRTLHLIYFIDSINKKGSTERLISE